MKAEERKEAGRKEEMKLTVNRKRRSQETGEKLELLVGLSGSVVISTSAERRAAAQGCAETISQRPEERIAGCGACNLKETADYKNSRCARNDNHPHSMKFSLNRAWKKNAGRQALIADACFASCAAAGD